MGAEIRTLHEDDFSAWNDAVHVGFMRPQLRGDADARRVGVDLDRAWGAFDGDRVVGTLRGFDAPVTVPGASIEASAISGVSVSSSHRRQGLLGGMITAELAAARERGLTVSVLVAANWPIYGRFGFGPGTEQASYAIEANLAALTPAADEASRAAGEVELVDVATFRMAAPAVYDRMRSRTSGAIGRSQQVWDVHAGLVSQSGGDAKDRLFALLRDGRGDVRGYVDYRVTRTDWHEGRPAYQLHTEDLVADDAYGEARLWRYLWEHDWVTRVNASFRRVDEPLPWLLRDARHMALTSRADFMWVRLLDIAGALAARGYGVADKLRLRVVPPTGARESYALGSARTYVLDGSPDGARCELTTAEPDVTLPLDALGALYLGGVSATRLAAVGLLREDTPGALARCDLLFAAPCAPWCNTLF